MIWKERKSVQTAYSGLTTAEAEASRKQFGDNSLSVKKKNGFFKSLLSSFADPIIKILLIALAVNIIFLFKTSDWFETLGIAVAIFLATFVSTLSEYGSEAAFKELQEEASKTMCRVRRDGEIREIPLADVVTGDLVLLEVGEKIPADGILLTGTLSVDQSALNGESKEAKKRPGSTVMEKMSLSDESALFRGCIVCSGEGTMRVAKVGGATLYGSMAEEVQEETRESPLKVRLAHLAGVISKLGYFAAFVVAGAYLFNIFLLDSGFSGAVIVQKLQNLPYLFHHLLNALTLAITVIVVAVPEGLPMMITVVLSSNMKRMLKDNVLVRKLVGIETAGSLNILFTDKTGTITRGALSVTNFISGSGKEYGTIQSLKKCRPLYELFELSAGLNTSSSITRDGVIGGNATDRAVLQAILPAKLPGDIKIRNKVPFDSVRKYSCVQIEGKKNLILIKGAPEKILTACDRFYDESGNVHAFHSRSVLQRRWNEMTKNAVRVLAFAVSDGEWSERGDFRNLILIGLAGIKDEIRPEAKRAIAEVRSAGVQVVMITGDNKETAAAIAKECGLILPYEKGIILTGDELAVTSDEQLKQLLPQLRVIARALPSDKSRLVRVAQECGLVAGMTGDGINDAPALKAADVGFVMGSGTEVAKEAGDIVILDNNFASIVKAVLYGRTIFKSIRKFIIFQLTMNLCAVGVSIIGPFIGIDAPVTVIQMLWVNIIMDTLGALAFAGEAPPPDCMREPPKSREEPILNRYMINQILVDGILTIGICILFLKLPVVKNWFRYWEDPIYFMTAFFALFIFAGVFNCFNARTNRMNLLAGLTKNKSFIIIMVLISIVQVIFIYFGGTLFRTAPLLAKEVCLVIMIAFLVIPADLARKVTLRIAGHRGSI